MTEITFNFDCLNSLRFIDLRNNKIYNLSNHTLAKFEDLPNRGLGVKIDLLVSFYLCSYFINIVVVDLVLMVFILGLWFIVFRVTHLSVIVSIILQTVIFLLLFNECIVNLIPKSGKIADFLNWVRSTNVNVLEKESYRCYDGLPTSNTDQYLLDIHKIQCATAFKQVI